MTRVHAYYNVARSWQEPEENKYTIQEPCEPMYNTINIIYIVHV